MKATDVINLIHSEEKGLEFMKTGFYQLDDWLDGGFFKKELVVIGGRTGIGKSYLASQLMYNIANQGFSTAYFSLEIENKMVISRIIGSIADIKPTRIRQGLLTKDEVENRNEAEAEIKSLSELMDFYDLVYKLTEIKSLVKKNKYEFVIIDFIQNVISSGDEYARLSKVALELQSLAKECNCTILALSQLSNTAAREGGSSKTIEYKGSGSIATVADLGFLIERSNNDWNRNGSNELKLSLKKNRRGGSGIDFNLIFENPGGKIHEGYQKTY